MLPLCRNISHAETVCILSKLHEAKHQVSMKLDMYEMDITEDESKATYEEVKKYVVVLMKEEIIHRWENG